MLPKNPQSLHQKTQMFLFPLLRAGGVPSPLPPRAPCKSFQPNNYSATIYLPHSRMENFQRYSYQEKDKISRHEAERGLLNDTGKLLMLACGGQILSSYLEQEEASFPEASPGEQAFFLASLLLGFISLLSLSVIFRERVRKWIIFFCLGHQVSRKACDASISSISFDAGYPRYPAKHVRI